MTSNEKKINKIKERGILFNTEMVRAVLDGHKTQTRRIVKDFWEDYPERAGEPLSLFRFKYDKGSTTYGNPIKIECPYGKAGDLLYVRETFSPDPPDDGTWDGYIEFSGCGEKVSMIPKRLIKPEHCIYKASWLGKDVPLNWKPSIHMKKEYARIWLKIISVKFEKLQYMSGEDLTKEGICYISAFGNCADMSDFSDLWDSVYKDSGNGWNTNPYVWVIEFERYYK